MKFPAALRRLASWLALLAVLMAALAPTISQALAARDAAPQLVRVCSVDGDKWRPFAIERKQPASHHGAHAFEHCPFCSLHADAAPLPAQPVALPLPLASDEAPAAFLDAPRTLHAWASAQPRAPPARG
ncbi:DUF2946 domain-containing protein [Derxia lacustris]|uniref:DUF2946 domain-containing protein n=1 Tax=Derxia lacustris TaxID=764842 RepID=UPI000A175ADD|nr:DUF2946 domain-containing protein [Derxia lacustris]